MKILAAAAAAGGGGGGDGGVVVVVVVVVGVGVGVGFHNLYALTRSPLLSAGVGGYIYIYIYIYMYVCMYIYIYTYIYIYIYMCRCIHIIYIMYTHISCTSDMTRFPNAVRSLINDPLLTLHAPGAVRLCWTPTYLPYTICSIYVIYLCSVYI